jgi:hypothetical protein
VTEGRAGRRCRWRCATATSRPTRGRSSCSRVSTTPPRSPSVSSSLSLHPPACLHLPRQPPGMLRELRELAGTRLPLRRHLSTVAAEATWRDATARGGQCGWTRTSGGRPSWASCRCSSTTGTSTPTLTSPSRSRSRPSPPPPPPRPTPPTPSRSSARLPLAEPAACMQLEARAAPMTGRGARLTARRRQRVLLQAFDTATHFAIVTDVCAAHPRLWTHVAAVALIWAVHSLICQVVLRPLPPALRLLPAHPALPCCSCVRERREERGQRREEAEREERGERREERGERRGERQEEGADGTGAPAWARAGDAQVHSHAVCRGLQERPLPRTPRL